MSARRASREPYRIGRSRREVWTAVGAALAIVLLTAVAVWILAPGDSSTPTGTPSVTASGSSATTVPTSTATTAPAEATTDTTGG